MLGWTHLKGQKETIKETKEIPFSVTYHVSFGTHSHWIINWIMKTCSALLVWRLHLNLKVYSQTKSFLQISKTFTNNAVQHTLFVTCRNPISFLNHVFTNTKIFVSDCLTWNMNRVYYLIHFWRTWHCERYIDDTMMSNAGQEN